MKTQLCLLLLILLFSCKKETLIEEPQSTWEQILPFVPGEQEHGTVEGINLGDEWIGSVRGFIFKKDSSVHLFCDRVSSKKSRFTEELAFFNLPLVSGQYFLSDNRDVMSLDSVQVSYYFNDWDVTAGKYLLNKDSSNILILSKIDTFERIIEGEFSGSFLLEGNSYEGTPESANFKNMRFTALIPH